MFPENIVTILKKYQPQNTEILDDINEAINKIKSSLQEINKIIAEDTKTLMLEEEVDNDIDILMEESKVLRKYIKSINTIDVWRDKISCAPESSEQFSVPMFDKTVRIFLLSDELCPFCNVRLSEHKVFYKKMVNNEIVNDQVIWYRCPSCMKMFTMDYDIKDFDFDSTNIILDKSKYTEAIDLNIYSAVVLKNTLNCSLNHDTKDVVAKIPILDKAGNVAYKTINASYCKTCSRFTILKEDFEKIEDIMLCKVIDETIDANTAKHDDNFESEQTKSILTQYGYNVQTKKDISKEQRHIILSSIIEAQIMNRRDVTNHLTTLVDRGSKISSWKLATQKWKEDIEYVNSYKINELPDVVFEKIILGYKQ